jgi:hypothetical protein
MSTEPGTAPIVSADAEPETQPRVPTEAVVARGQHPAAPQIRVSSASDSDNLDLYDGDRVIGGLGAFAVSIKDREKFKEAIRATRARKRRPDAGSVSWSLSSKMGLGCAA